MPMDLDGLFKSAKNHLLKHTLHESINHIDDIRCFTEYHIFAVWDYMSLLKSLQSRFTCTKVPWYPVGEPGIRKLINELVLSEESDTIVGGMSHFEWYLAAMRQIGADTSAIDELIMLLEQGQDYSLLLEKLPPPCFQLVKHSLDLSLHGQTHEIAAAFFIGREQLIPGLFGEFIQILSSHYNKNLSSLLHLFQRRLEVDTDTQKPMIEQLLRSLCSNNKNKTIECENAAINAIKAKIELWDGILAKIMSTRSAASGNSIAV